MDQKSFTVIWSRKNYEEIWSYSGGSMGFGEPEHVLSSRSEWGGSKKVIKSHTNIIIDKAVQ